MTRLIHSLFDPASLIHSQTFSVCLGLAKIFNLLAILANFCYYLWVPLHFLILFTGPIVLFSLFFNHFTALLTKSFQFQLNKLFPDEPLASFIHFQPLLSLSPPISLPISPLILMSISRLVSPHHMSPISALNIASDLIKKLLPSCQPWPTASHQLSLIA